MENNIFVYGCPTLVEVNSKLNYTFDGATGNIDFDYANAIKNGDMNLFSLNYAENINRIKSDLGISMFLNNNIYDITNGYENILYVMKNGNEKLPVMLYKTFDEETNRLLVELGKNCLIYKNNILNDDINLLLFTKDGLFEIESREQLISLKDNNLRPKFIDKVYPENDTPSSYQKIIYERYLEYGASVLTGNYSEILKLFPQMNNRSFYLVYNAMKSYYKRSLISNFDFNKTFNTSCNESKKF